MLKKVPALWSQPWPELLGRGCGGMQRHREGCRGQGLLGAHNVTCGAGAFSLPLPLPDITLLLFLPSAGSEEVREGERAQGPGKLKPAEREMPMHHRRPAPARWFLQKTALSAFLNYI